MSDTTDFAAMVGQISWTEIPVVDLARAQAFYKEVFEWEFTIMPTGGEPMVALFTKGPCHGSLVKVDPDNFLSPAMHTDNLDKGRIAVRVTITMASVDDTIKAVEKAGGALYLPKREIPGDMGVVAYFTDTEKNVMGVWSKN